jgi:hypothetical protein
MDYGTINGSHVLARTALTLGLLTSHEDLAQPIPRLSKCNVVAVVAPLTFSRQTLPDEQKQGSQVRWNHALTISVNHVVFKDVVSSTTQQQGNRYVVKRVVDNEATTGKIIQIDSL